LKASAIYGEAVQSNGSYAERAIMQSALPPDLSRRLYERSAAFKKGQRFRAGIEGRISVLSRGRGMKRCLAEGSARFGLLVGAAVLANNLMVIAPLLAKRSSRRRRDSG